MAFEQGDPNIPWMLFPAQAGTKKYIDPSDSDCKKANLPLTPKCFA